LSGAFAASNLRQFHWDAVKQTKVVDGTMWQEFESSLSLDGMNLDSLFAKKKVQVNLQKKQKRPKDTSI
jgi:hypothetical protein